ITVRSPSTKTGNWPVGARRLTASAFSVDHQKFEWHVAQLNQPLAVGRGFSELVYKHAISTIMPVGSLKMYEV
ncbi:MAG: hypothetical protein ACM3VT_10590, partial [Solirubrobacterales bacterium]